MTCPQCQIAFDPDHWDACPHCGREHEIARTMKFTGVMRTSTVLIAAGKDEPTIYGSVEEVPEPLRRLLVTSTNGLNSGTIYIADQGGREQMTRMLQDLRDVNPAPALTRVPASLSASPERPPRRPVSLATLWFALVVATFSGAVIWLAESRSW